MADELLSDVPLPTLAIDHRVAPFVSEPRRVVPSLGGCRCNGRATRARQSRERTQLAWIEDVARLSSQYFRFQNVAKSNDQDALEIAKRVDSTGGVMQFDHRVRSREDSEGHRRSPHGPVRVSIPTIEKETGSRFA
jgi:hypothetical protein